MPFGGAPNVDDPTSIDTFTPGLTIDTQRFRTGHNNQNFLARVTRTPGGLADLAARRLPGLVDETAALRASFAPGFGIISQRAQESGERALGNLRNTLAQRRIRGSTFGEAAIARTRRENQAIAAEAALQELQIENELIAQESQLLAQGVNQVLAEAGLASGQAQTLAQLFTQADALQAQLKAQSQSSLFGGLGQLVGTVAGFGLTGGFGNLFGGGSALAAPSSIPTTDFLGNPFRAPGSIANAGGSLSFGR